MFQRQSCQVGLGRSACSRGMDGPREGWTLQRSSLSGRAPEGTAQSALVGIQMPQHHHRLLEIVAALSPCHLLHLLPRLWMGHSTNNRAATGPSVWEYSWLFLLYQSKLQISKDSKIQSKSPLTSTCWWAGGAAPRYSCLLIFGSAFLRQYRRGVAEWLRLRECNPLHGFVHGLPFGDPGI